MTYYRFDQGPARQTYLPCGWIMTAPALDDDTNPFPITPSWRYYTEESDQFRAAVCGALPSEL